MNYKKIYESLIYRAKQRELEGYKERHHILPRCMGGDDSKDNLVDLTPEEHYVCHQLLVKIYPSEDKLVYACNFMNSKGNNKIYGWVKRKNSKAISRLNKGKASPRKGKTQKEIFGEDYVHPNKGKTCKEIHGEDYVNPNKGKKIKQPKLSKSLYITSNKGKVWYESLNECSRQTRLPLNTLQKLSKQGWFKIKRRKTTTHEFDDQIITLDFC